MCTTCLRDATGSGSNYSITDVYNWCLPIVRVAVSPNDPLTRGYHHLITSIGNRWFPSLRIAYVRACIRLIDARGYNTQFIRLKKKEQKKNIIYDRERERNVLFNDVLNTFYLRLYGVRHMVKDHSDSEKGNPLPPHRLLLSINSKGSFICTIPQTG